jgi:hypothetical protein
MTTGLGKRALYEAAIKLMRKPAGGTVFLPYARIGKGPIAAVRCSNHLACEPDEARAMDYNQRWPDHSIDCMDRLEWLDNGLQSEYDVIAVDFDAKRDPFDAVEVFLRHAQLDRYCLFFLSWGFQRSPRLKPLGRIDKNQTQVKVLEVMTKTLGQLADAMGFTVKPLGAALPEVTRAPAVLSAVYSVVNKGGLHVEGEIGGLDPQPPPDEKPSPMLELDKMDPERRAHTLALLQFTKAEIEAIETGDPYDRAVLTGEAQTRFALFNTALGGNPQALKLMAEVIRNRKYQERLIEGRAKLQRTNKAES